MSDLTNTSSTIENEDYGYTNRIAMLREKEGLTQTEFAEKFGMSAVLVSDMERKQKRLSLRNAIQISKTFNVSLDWLYELNDDTRDNASNMINDLRDLFNIDLKNKTISIEKSLAEFLDKLSDAYKTKAEKNIPEDGFRFWLDGIKKEYNDKVIENKGSEKSYTKYNMESEEPIVVTTSEETIDKFNKEQ